MAIQFLTITQEEIDKKLAESLRSRELELLSYYAEKKSHEEILATLADIDWDETNIKYKIPGITRDRFIAMAKDDNLDSETIQHIARLHAKEQHKHALEAVAIETGKSERSYASVTSELPEGKRRDDALAAVLAEEAARKA